MAPNHLSVSMISILNILLLSGISRQTYAANKPMASLLQGNFSEDGATLTVSASEQHFDYWNSETRATEGVMCGDLFINNRELLGPSAVCRLRGRVIEISLGPGATIQPTISSISARVTG